MHASFICFREGSCSPLSLVNSFRRIIVFLTTFFFIIVLWFFTQPNQGLVAMDNEDMTIIVIMNGPTCITGTDDHTMKKFIAAKKRQLGMEARDAQGRSPKQPRRIV